MMVEAMQRAFKQNLEFIDWMSPQSAEAARAKLEHMVDLIGYPAFVLNNTWLDQGKKIILHPHDKYVLQQLLLLAYKDLDIQVGTYLMNVANHRKFARRMELQDFFETPIRGTWNDFSHMANIATVNAYYNQATNTMVVPIGMLQPPLFWSTPKSLTFGAFGIVVGESLSLNNQRSMPNLLKKHIQKWPFIILSAHEITHAFDEVGIMYNSQGHFKPLYDNDTVEAFHKASDCIRKQYSTFNLDGMPVDGNTTLGENIADHGGLRIAEIAYENWLNLNNGSDALLPALQDFTYMQLFYLGYALPWCATHTESMLPQIIKDEHAPDRFRVLGPLSNSAKFAETWGCAPKSAMNPPDKCPIWGNDYSNKGN